MGGIQSQEVGFVEHFIGSSTCEEMPYTSVVFGAPSTSIGGQGYLEDPKENGECAGKENFNFTRNADVSVEISAGFHAEVVELRLQYEGY
jgi:hypothetical protein